MHAFPYPFSVQMMHKNFESLTNASIDRECGEKKVDLVRSGPMIYLSMNLKLRLWSGKKKTIIKKYDWFRGFRAVLHLIAGYSLLILQLFSFFFFGVRYIPAIHVYEIAILGIASGR